jgi:hypothetical protein
MRYNLSLEGKIRENKEVDLVTQNPLLRITGNFLVTKIG